MSVVEKDPTSPELGKPGLGLRAFFAPILVALVVAHLWKDHATHARPEMEPGATRVPARELPDFKLIERSGATVTRATLAGRPYIASFIFTQCQGPCPQLTSRVRQLQAELEKHHTTVRLASFSVDPRNDTPEVLRRYADSATADTERWLFLTGDEAAVTSLVVEGFGLGIARDPTATEPVERLTHDTHLVLVDAKGAVRGYYDSESEEGRAAVLEDALALAALSASGRTSPLPPVNASLNALSALLLLIGYALIKRGNVAAHKWCMLSAIFVSAAFLACYLIHHAQHGSTPFAGQGTPKTIYLVILLTHVVLAIVVVPLVVAVARLGLKGRFDAHARLARWTFPIWLYVSVTGVAVYLLLYEIYV